MKHSEANKAQDQNTYLWQNSVLVEGLPFDQHTVSGLVDAVRGRQPRGNATVLALGRSSFDFAPSAECGGD